MTRGERFFLLATFAGVLGLYAAISGLRPWVAPDTPGYLAAAAAAEPWGQMRHPLFGWLWAPFFRGDQLRLSVGVQVLAFLASVAGLAWALGRVGVSAIGRAAVSLVLLLSNCALIWHNAVHPEFLATALAVAALAALLLATAVKRRCWLAVLAYGGLLGLAVVLRPIFLVAVLVLPLLVPLIRRACGFGWSPGLAVAILLAGALPLAAQSAFRAAKVGDFNIVSFGGYQMSGLAGLILTPQIAARLPEDLRPLAGSIIVARGAAEQAGRVLATPTNSTGQRSFASAAVGYFDIYARTYDALLWGEIAPLQGQVSWIAFNRVLMRLSLATVAAAPVEYGAWVVGATARTVGRATVTNLAFMLGLLGLVGLVGVSILTSGSMPALGVGERDWAILVPLVVAYTVAVGVLGIATTFPAARYIDTAALFLPVLTVYPALAGWCRLWIGRQDRHRVD